MPELQSARKLTLQVVGPIDFEMSSFKEIIHDRSVSFYWMQDTTTSNIGYLRSLSINFHWRFFHWVSCFINDEDYPESAKNKL